MSPWGTAWTLGLLIVVSYLAGATHAALLLNRKRAAPPSPEPAPVATVEPATEPRATVERRPGRGEVWVQMDRPSYETLLVVLGRCDTRFLVRDAGQQDWVSVQARAFAESLDPSDLTD